jgi:hypothetical protein
MEIPFMYDQNDLTSEGASKSLLSFAFLAHQCYDKTPGQASSASVVPQGTRHPVDPEISAYEPHGWRSCLPMHSTFVQQVPRAGGPLLTARLLTADTYREHPELILA